MVNLMFIKTNGNNEKAVTIMLEEYVNEGKMSI